jgi:multidrug efflux pump subunit AcrB
MAQGRRISPLKAYLKAFNHKVVPILLTIVSTVLGLVPFIYDGPTAGFWYTLALGAGGGLLFSIPAVFVWFPLVMVGRERKVSEEVPKCVKQCLSA